MGFVTVSLRLLLTAAFLFLGANKLTDSINPQLNAELTRAFANEWTPVINKYAQGHYVFDAAQVQLLTGVLEVSAALMLWVNASLATLVLTGIMGTALAIHVELKDAIEKLAPAAVLLFLVILHVVASAGGSSSSSSSASSKSKNKKKKRATNERHT